MLLLGKKIDDSQKFGLTHYNHCMEAIFYYCILRGQIKGFNSSITTILFEAGCGKPEQAPH